MKSRVVVTGVGVVSPFGTGKDKLWEALLAGESGVGPITRFDASDFTTRFAAEVTDFDPAQFVDKKDARRLDRFIQYAWASTQMALEDAGLDVTKVDGERMGVLIGSGIGGIETLESQVTTLVQRGPSQRQSVSRADDDSGHGVGLRFHSNGSARPQRVHGHRVRVGGSFHWRCCPHY